MISIEDLSQISQAEKEAKDAVPNQINVCVARYLECLFQKVPP